MGSAPLAEPSLGRPSCLGAPRLTRVHAVLRSPHRASTPRIGAVPCPASPHQPAPTPRRQTITHVAGFNSQLYENYRDTVKADTFKEGSRQARRATFTFADWKRHRSGERYLHHMSTLVESGIVRGIAGPVLLITLITAVVAALNAAHAAALLPTWVPPMPCIAIEPVQLTSIALSLLLVFRTNASYSRWDEGRRSFGSITTVSRDIARQAFAWFRPGDYESRARLGRWLVALCRSTMVNLRDEHNLQAEMREVLQPEEVQAVVEALHPPSFCLQMITWIIQSAGLPQELVIRMDENVSRLTDGVSACERILNTPIPLSYTRHTARFLMAWLCCLPFCLWTYCGVAMVPIAALIAFVLLGIEEIGVYIEEPFSILALEKLVNKLENIINAMLREHKDLEEIFRTVSPAPPPAPPPPPPPPVLEPVQAASPRRGSVRAGLSNAAAAAASAAAAAAAMLPQLNAF
ncbi:hypothetical protein HYH03_007150 [Edaphochlamys debaryana]|uniref:Uncharacterized protein n=1 Tax=Edaphochlamys debaryana TaxID=47281 RepID=A0A835Y5P2_9CHLO|nr:hypothetical protein HYH03_007150 [Edaphochlamys debaryana]|eukprot:KAG2494631.1 hypothetical protein HYH03_007150 [Edaphochlamys debaryana]